MFLIVLCVLAGEEGGTGSVATGAADGIGDACDSEVPFQILQIL